MHSLPAPQTVECKTLDGISLEGWFYEVEGPAPAIVMTHGYNCVKEMSLAETAEAFQSAGYNVFLYDPRGIGGSGGFPRNQLDPLQNAEDISDVVSYVATFPSVNPRQIMLWGMSSGGTISGCAAAVDRRVVALVMVSPIFRFVRPDTRKKAFSLLMKDRQSQLRGNKPLEIQPFDSKGENAIGYAGSGGPGGMEAYILMKTAVERGHHNFRDRITLQSYHKIALFRPKEILAEMLEGIPTMIVTLELDNISPPADQKAVFESLQTPKRFHLVKGGNHMSILSEVGSEETRATMIEFFKSALEGTIA